MDVRTLVDESWSLLASRPTTAPSLAPAEQVVLGEVDEPYVCIMVSNDGSLHLLLALADQEDEKVIDPKVIGLRVGLLPSHLVLGRERQAYIDVQCTSLAFQHAFTLIVAEIASQVLRDRQRPVHAVNLTVRLWKSFWGREPGPLLTESEQLGLIAELLFLERLLTQGADAAVTAWTGPSGGVYDFSFATHAFEVKASVGIQHRHQVNGLYQLVVPEDGTLTLISYLGTRVTSGGVSLADQVARLLNLLDASPSAPDSFLLKLSLAGYLPEHSDQYRQVRFVVVEPHAFPVSEGFPAITPRSFKEPPSTRISALRYLLDLDGLECFGLDSESFEGLLSDLGQG